MTIEPPGTDRRSQLGGWAIDLTAGIAAGSVVGVILALNIVIFSGVDDGYQASVRAVFEQRPWAGVMAGMAIILSPVLLVLSLRRLRQNRA